MSVSPLDRFGFIQKKPKTVTRWDSSTQQQGSTTLILDAENRTARLHGENEEEC